MDNENNCTPPLRSLKTLAIPKSANLDPRRSFRSLKESFSYIKTVSGHPFFVLLNMIKDKTWFKKEGMNSDERSDVSHSKKK